MFELVGHEFTKKDVMVAWESAKKRNASLPHMLFAGAAGCGKTSMARAVADMCRTDFLAVFPDSLKEKEDILSFLEGLNHDGYNEKGDRVGTIRPSIVFIDEIHRLNMTAQETLGIAMEEFRVPSGTPNRFYWLPYFTLIGATTDDGKLSKPFRDRMKIKYIFEPYSMEESVEIVKRHAVRLEVGITNKAAQAIAMRGRGVPRILVGYLERVRDYSLSIGSYFIQSGAVEKVFRNMGVDKEGLTPVELKILRTLYETKEAVGLDNLSVIVNEPSKTITQSVEPFLIQKGLILRSGKGRKITQKGIEYLETFSGAEIKRKKKVEIPATYVRT